MKKVFIVVPTLGTGGGEKVVLDLMQNINREKFDVYLYCLFGKSKTIYSDELEKYGTKIYYLDKKLGFDIKVIWKLIKVINREKPDVIHTHLNVMQFILPAFIFTKVKVKLHTVHSIAEKESEGIVRKIMYTAIKYFGVRLIAISPTVKESIVNLYNLDSDKVVCVNNGIDLKKYSSKEKNNSGILNFICVGRLCEVKNHEFILRAFSEVSKKYNNIKLTIVGDGELRNNLEKMVCDLNIEKRVHFKGAIPDVEEELRDADIFLMSSIYEGLPLSILEAMATGLPIISTNVGGIPDIVRHMENGILIESMNEKEFVNAMEMLLEDNSFKKIMGEKSLEFSKKYDVRKMAREYEKIYDMN